MTIRGSRERGASLVEVLVSMLVVAIGMLGVMGLQLRAVAQQTDSLEGRTAALTASAFADRVAANFGGVEVGAYSTYSFASSDDLPAAPDCEDADCTAAETAARDLWMLARDVRERLPEGAAFVARDADLGRLSVTVAWRDPQRRAGSVTATDPLCPAAITEATFRCYRLLFYP